jgi:hypothetical protein
MAHGLPRARGMARRAERTLITGLALLAGLAALGATLWPTEPDEWAVLLAAGDALAAGRPPTPVAAVHPGRLTPRVAYLLAYHHAQDREEVGRMRVAAGRLDRIGEAALAAQVRAAALAVEAGRGRRAPAPGGSARHERELLE